MSLNRDFDALPFRHRIALTAASMAFFAGFGLLLAHNKEHIAAFGCGGLLVLLLLKRVIFTAVLRGAVTALKHAEPPEPPDRKAEPLAPCAPPAPGSAGRGTPPAPAPGGRTRRLGRLPFGRRSPRRQR